MKPHQIREIQETFICQIIKRESVILQSMWVDKIVWMCDKKSWSTFVERKSQMQIPMRGQNRRFPSCTLSEGCNRFQQSIEFKKEYSSGAFRYLRCEWSCTVRKKAEEETELMDRQNQNEKAASLPPLRFPLWIELLLLKLKEPCRDLARTVLLLILRLAGEGQDSSNLSLESGSRFSIFLISFFLSPPCLSLFFSHFRLPWRRSEDR